MNKLQKLLIVLLLILFVSVFYGCDGMFPTSPKSAIPTDHTNNIKGALHKGEGGGGGKSLNPDECNDCHSLDDIRGKISLINGIPTWAPSCYQCHGALWNRNGGGGNKLY
ncbi:MAG TPA: hypothetical protein VIK14_16125 [Ignavibacteria bacterium]